MDLNDFKKLPVMGIIRGIGINDIVPLMETIIGAGLETVEITMNTKDAASIISRSRRVAGKNMSVGAGTVLSVKDLDAALDSGAEFIVMPMYDEAIVSRCVSAGVPVFPGALTPGEVFKAWAQGAAMVKIFPAHFCGVRYFKELKGPFDQVKLMAVGGVKADNIKDYLENGADAVAFGSSIFRKELLEKKDFETIGCLVRDFVEIVRDAKDK